MKEKVKAQLKAKYTGVPDALLDRFAETLSKNITEESQIEDAVNGAEIGIKTAQDFAQAESDRRVTEALKKAAKPNEPKLPEPTEPPAQGQQPDIATLIKEALSPLSQEIASLKTEAATKTNSQIISSFLNEKKVPESYSKLVLEGRQFANPEEAKTFAESIATNYETFQSEQSATLLANQTRPFQAGGSGNSEADKQMIKDIVSKKIQ